ncbi:MAG: hypothetical protein HOJ90_11720 [Alphaproteobacteria bacterium]|jgi:hypothetical protein|nr:hypothetical protein [Alphaproteobacteria bacterium]
MHGLRTLFGVVFLFGMLAVPGVQAQDAIPQGVKVGSAIPHMLEVPDQTSQVQSFGALKKTRGLILIFSRSLSW